MRLFRPGRRAIPVEPPNRVEHTASGRTGTKTLQEHRHGLDGFWVRWDRLSRRPTWHPAGVLRDLPDGPLRLIVPPEAQP